jgi:hypothetical protein
MECGMKTRIPRLLLIALLAACLIGFLVAGFWAGKRYSELRTVVTECRSESRFAQIEAMLLNYHDQHGAFPPIKYQPKTNGPIHSWRVLLMPYADVDFKERLAKYDFSQEWNSPENLKALANMRYFNYLSGNADNEITDYLAIGDGDEWPSHKPLKSYLVTKGKDRFLLVEYPDSDVRWMEPRY